MSHTRDEKHFPEQDMGIQKFNKKIKFSFIKKKRGTKRREHENQPLGSILLASSLLSRERVDGLQSAHRWLCTQEGSPHTHTHVFILSIFCLSV